MSISYNGGESMREDFCVFILTHGRCDILKTTEALKRANYTGKILYILDNEDATVDQYKAKFGADNIYVFDKAEVAKSVDTMDLSKDRRAIVYARNHCYKIAKELGYKYFLQLDDDFNNFRGRRFVDGKFISIYLRDFDGLVDTMLEFLDTSGAHIVAMSQTGDFIGGPKSKLYVDKIRRKSMNAMFCRADKPVEFKGRMNEDVTSYVSNGSRGKIFFTIRDISVDQLATQSLKGGMSESYSNAGTYIKSFYTVMCCPSSVSVSTVGESRTDRAHHRIHHVVDWEHAVPKIISSKYKKEKKKNEINN